MYLYTLILVLSCVIAWVTKTVQDYRFAIGNIKSRISIKKVGFFLCFGFLAFFSAIRDGVGCDYNSYVRHILNIQAGNYSYMEIGFQKVVLFFERIDPNPRFVIIVFGILTCFFYIKAIWDQSDDIPFSVFIFLAWGYYFLTYNTVRNYFALALVIYSIKFLQNKQILRFVIIVLIASLFHKSALVCIPLYLVAKLKFNKKHIFLFVGIIVICLAAQGVISGIVYRIYPGYLNSVYDTSRISYLNILKALLVLVFGSFYFSNIKDDYLGRFYFNLNTFSLIFYVGMYWLPEISRIGFYMNATTILLLPRIVNRIQDLESKRIIKFALIVLSLVLFVLLMFQFSEETTRLLPYSSWLFDGSYDTYYTN